MPRNPLTPAARALRRRQTAAEDLLWESLRKRQLAGLKFRRQPPVETFIADFYCHESRLVVEVDGGIHESRPQRLRDDNRDLALRELGYRVLRFRNEEVLDGLDGVLKVILREALTPRPPLPGGEGE